jgi:hypothetical protein
MAEFEVQKGHIFRHFLSILQQFWECRFLTQNGPDSPQNHPQGFQFSYNLLYDISIFHRSIENLLEGRFWGGNCLKKAKIGKFCISIVRPNLFNMVKYALDAVRRITVPTVLIPHPQKIKILLDFAPSPDPKDNYFVPSPHQPCRVSDPV